jgi:hypothetical protein
LLSLVFSLSPFALMAAASVFRFGTGSWLLFILLCPIIGAVVGVVALTRPGGLKLAGRILSIVAIAVPVVFIALFLFFFLGVATGLIPLM